jgi:hypothetical protein
MLGPAHTRSGPGEDMTKQPSPALLDPTTSGNWRRSAQRVQGQPTGIDATRSPYRGSTTIIRTRTDRTLKASPAGGLRPALTVLPRPPPPSPGHLRAPAPQTAPRRARHPKAKTDSATQRLCLTKPATSDMPICAAASATALGFLSARSARPPTAHSGDAPPGYHRAVWGTLWRV